jgi:hypothetical protein
MIDLYRVLINGIIKHFNRVRRPVETNEAVFIITVLQLAVIDSGFVCVPNIRLCYAMLERRRHKDNFQLHTPNLRQKARFGKAGLRHWQVAAASRAHRCKLAVFGKPRGKHKRLQNILALKARIINKQFVNRLSRANLRKHPAHRNAQPAYTSLAPHNGRVPSYPVKLFHTNQYTAPAGQRQGAAV